MNAKSLLPLLTALLIAPAAVPLLPATVRAQTTTETDAAALLEEADRLYQQGLEQFDTSQFQAALDSWQAALGLYQDIGSRQEEGDTLNPTFRRLTGLNLGDSSGRTESP